MSIRRAIDLFIAGTCWGAAAYLLGGRAFGRAIWVGVLLSPVIGLGVGALLQPAFTRAEGWSRSACALLSLYAGGTLFGLAIGLGKWLGSAPWSSKWPEVVLEPVLSVWWGMTLTGFVIALWPLAYATHRWLEWREER